MPVLTVTAGLVLPSLEDVKYHVLQLRKSSLEENSKQLNKEFSHKTLHDFMLKEGLPVSTQTISFNNYPRHPICDVLSNISKQMTDVISEIVLFEDSPFTDYHETPELLDVEYLPLPTKGLYFSPKRGNPLATRKHSQFVLSALFNIQKGKLATVPTSVQPNSSDLLFADDLFTDDNDG